MLTTGLNSDFLAFAVLKAFSLVSEGRFSGSEQEANRNALRYQIYVSCVHNPSQDSIH